MRLRNVFKHPPIYIFLFMFGLIGLALTAGLIGNMLACTVNEAMAHPCLFLGYDIGEILYSAGVLGWLSLITLPTGGLCLLGYFIYLARKY